MQLTSALQCCALCDHCICNFFKSGDVCTCYIVALYTISLCRVRDLCIDVVHHLFELCIYLFCGQLRRMLFWHISSGGTYTTCIGCLTWQKQKSALQDVICSFSGSRHVCTLCYNLTAVCFQCLCIVEVQLVLCCTSEVRCRIYCPDALALCINFTGTACAYSLILPRRTSLISFRSSLMPSDRKRIRWSRSLQQPLRQAAVPSL